MGDIRQEILAIHCPWCGKEWRFIASGVEWVLEQSNTHSETVHSDIDPYTRISDQHRPGPFPGTVRTPPHQIG